MILSDEGQAVMGMYRSLFRKDKMRKPLFEELLEAAARSFPDQSDSDLEIARKFMKEPVKRIMQWLRENPVVPSHEELKSIILCCSKDGGSVRDLFMRAFPEWQRRMFTAPDPEVSRVPMEVFRKCEDVLGHASGLVDTIYLVQIASEAYRLGQKSKE